MVVWFITNSTTNIVNKIKQSIHKMFISHPVITCSKLTIGTLEQGVKYVQSQQYCFSC